MGTSGAGLIFYHLKGLGIDFQKEYQFHKPRKFRFDFAIPDKKIAIEYEGVISEKSRHTTMKGYSNDCEKYNLAALCGWTVLRYTALNIGQFVNDITTIMEARKTKEDWEGATQEDMNAELERCKNSTAYFYNKYFKRDGDPEITDEYIEGVRRTLGEKVSTKHTTINRTK